jgi:hypothetical protein
MTSFRAKPPGTVCGQSAEMGKGHPIPEIKLTLLPVEISEDTFEPQLWPLAPMES